ncbi:MAG: redox-regulated ATPase YchF [Bacilli bacterium]|jgi:GTP-binding protein YchF|nr:redox-regulated ATPase YchF [Bacilli bacterium]HHU24192.1 redox-regulated ATPase YchF [Acholeplasmataceae bacterium]
MSLTAGIVGLPNVGKSTLFNAITKSKVLAENYPFATIEPNVGIVEINDPRVDALAKIYNPKIVVRTTFSFTDIAGLVKGASRGEGLGNQFLSHIRNVDAICHVVRCFDDANITHVDGTVNPARDIETIQLELIFADLEMIEKRIPKIEKKAQLKVDEEAVEEYDLLLKLKDHLLQGFPARSLTFNDMETPILKHYQLLTMKPVVYVANVSETDVVKGNAYVEEVKKIAFQEGSEVLTICAKIEEELAELDPEDKVMFLEEMGLSESGLDRLVKTSYHLLGLSTFLTGGEKEVRAWTFKRGMKAPECAGIIHSDFERGFIRAEIMHFDDLMKYGTPAKVKEAGRYRIEGKDYVVQDGDIIYYRFNV